MLSSIQQFEDNLEKHYQKSKKIAYYKKEAENIINDIFKVMITSENKEDWIKWFIFIEKQLQNNIVWENKFIWRKIRSILNNMYWKKFINNIKNF